MTHKSLHDSETEQLHGRQAALKQLLESAFPPVFPSDPDPEKAIQWIAGNMDKGLCRVYAVSISECLNAKQQEQLVERGRQRIDDPQMIESLKEILVASSHPDDPSQESLAPVLANIAFESIDQILQQAKSLGREENFLHVQCTRVGNQLIVLSDRDPRYDWIVPAVQKRLREELAGLHYDPATIESQFLDMTCGQPLRFLGFEMRYVQGKHGERRVRYRLLKETKDVPAASTSPRALPRRRYHPLRLVWPCLNWIGRQPIWQVVQEACSKASAIQIGWRHLPIALFPVLMYFFSWRSPAPWLCLALIFVGNGRWILSTLKSMGTWARRNKLAAAMGTCALAALICLASFIGSKIYANRPHEVAASSSLPQGFYLGEYHGDSWWYGQPTPGISYGLYVPPHLQGRKGPFPLIVFLHSHGDRNKARIFQAGLPMSIVHRFGTYGPNGLFEFIAFLPIDPTGYWQAGTAEVENAMKVLDYVIARHRIDPSRVYLTGLSSGGSGVWSLAQAYPNKWAAVVPVCGFISPDVAKVRHLPAWIFHGDQDQYAPVERERILVRQLKEAGAEVRYTEFPKKNHTIGRESYDPKELYDWLATKKKD